MDYLSREGAPLSDGVWEQIDKVVISAAQHVLTGRRFLSLFGPLGIGVQSIQVDATDGVEEVEQDGFIATRGRKLVELPLLYADFTLFSRDMESSEINGYPLDLSRAAAAAQACAIKEDTLLFFGNKKLGYEGLLTASGAGKVQKGDWSEGETAFSDIAAGLETLAAQHIYGRTSLVLSPDLYRQLQRLQPGTGLLELERVTKLVDGRLYQTPVLGQNKAVLVCAEASNLDLVVGQDMAAAYLEQKDLNHCFRILESILLRIKRPKAIVVFE